jgi:hypothetical protein
MNAASIALLPAGAGAARRSELGRHSIEAYVRLWSTLQVRTSEVGLGLCALSRVLTMTGRV